MKPISINNNPDELSSNPEYFLEFCEDVLKNKKQYIEKGGDKLIVEITRMLANLKKEKKDASKLFNFRVGYWQHITTILKKPKFISAVELVRRKLGIPQYGFKRGDGPTFKKWCKDGCYKIIPDILNEVKVNIKTNSKPLFDFLEGIDFDLELYLSHYFIDDYILDCPTVTMYENYITEKPFAGVMEYILFNTFVIPRHGFISIFEYKDFSVNNDNNFLMLLISPQTPITHINGVLKEISERNKKMPGYKKRTLYSKTKKFNNPINLMNRKPGYKMSSAERKMISRWKKELDNF